MNSWRTGDRPSDVLDAEQSSNLLIYCYVRRLDFTAERHLTEDPGWVTGTTTVNKHLVAPKLGIVHVQGGL